MDLGLHSVLVTCSVLLLAGFHGFPHQHHFCHAIRSQMFTPTVDLEELTTSTVHLLENYLTDYVLREDLRNGSIKRYLKEFRQLSHIIRKTGGEQYLSNPVNEFLLIKRLTYDWVQTKTLIESVGSNGTNEVVRNLEELLVLPSQDDLGGAALGLLRLQSVYQLSTSVIATGELLTNSNYQHKQQMTASDCWNLGQQAYLIGEDNQSLSWMEESLSRFYNEIDKTLSIEKILLYLSFASFKIGDVERASLLTEQLLESSLSTPMELKSQFKAVEEARSIRIGETAQQNHDQIYKALCRGENLMEPLAEAQLKCYVSSMSNPFLIIQPVKMEQISISPPVSVFYDVVSDKEIEKVQKLANPMFESSRTQFLDGTGFSQIKVNNIAKISPEMEKDSIINRITNQRVKDITGLDPWKGSSVFNYGIGGHFSAHVDHYGNGSSIELVHGDRLGTWIYYLNDVEAGGLTVFLKAKTSIKPVKGSAAFWYNLYPSGEGNPNSLHAACPVLAGNKWVLLKAIYSNGQEFRRPCRLDPEAEL